MARSPAAVISVLDRYAGIFRGRKARLSRVRARSAPPKAPLTAAPRPQDGRRAIKDGLCVNVQPVLDNSQTVSTDPIALHDEMKAERLLRRADAAE